MRSYEDYVNVIYNQFVHRPEDLYDYKLAKKRLNSKINLKDALDDTIIDYIVVPNYVNIVEKFKVYKKFKEYANKYIKDLVKKINKCENGLTNASLDSIKYTLLTPIYEMFVNEKFYFFKQINELDSIFNMVFTHKVEMKPVEFREEEIEIFLNLYWYYVIDYIKTKFIEDINSSIDEDFNTIKIDINHYFTYLSTLKLNNINRIVILYNTILNITEESEINIIEFIKMLTDVGMLIGKNSTEQYDSYKQYSRTLGRIDDLRTDFITYSKEKNNTDSEIISKICKFDKIKELKLDLINIKSTKMKQIQLCYAFDLKDYFNWYVFITEYDSITFLVDKIFNMIL